MNTVFLALGANTGNKPISLLRSLSFIAKKIGKITAVSSVYETIPEGFESENKFLNMMVCVETLMSPEKILTVTQSIEKKIGRVTKSNDCYHDRIIDIDIIACNDLILNTENLQLPHPHFHKRRFVLEPFNEIAPEYVHPVLHKTVWEILKEDIF